MTKASVASYVLGGLVAGTMLLGAGSAFAQDSNSALRSTIGQLKQQMQQMQQQIDNLSQQEQRNEEKANAAAQAAANVATRVPPANAPRVTESATHRFGLSSADGQNTIELTGRLHIDTADYLNYSPKAGTLDKSLASGINLRRARIGVTGKFQGDWTYALIYDFGGTSDSLNFNNAGANGNSGTSPTTSNSALSGVENAVITYNGFYSHGQQFPVAIDFGVMDVPWTLDKSTSSNDIMFMERSSSQVAATLYGGGNSRTALGIRSNDQRYWAGMYLTGPNVGALHSDASCVASPVVAGTPCQTGTAAVSSFPGNGPQFAFLARAGYQVLQGDNYSLHIGANFADTFQPRAGANVSGFSLSDRPELRVDPTALIGTGTVGSSGGMVIGGELAATYEGAYLQGEYFHYSMDEAHEIGAALPAGKGPFPTLDFNGGYVQASYSFGGRRHYNPAAGAYTGVIPDHPLSWSNGGWGAIELAGRYSTVNLDDGVTGASCAGGVTVCGGRQSTYAFGVNYYPNLNMRFMLDYEHVDVNIPSVLGGPNTKGATIDYVAARTQINF